MNISSQVLNAEQFFSVNGQPLSGVSSVSMGYNNSLENSPSLGNAGFGFILNAPIEASVDISRFLLAADPVLAFTGNSSFSGSFNYGGRAYFFESGYLSNYSVSCGVGQIPEVNTRVSVFCGLKSGEIISVPVIEESLFIPSPRSISVSGMDFSTNRVRQFNYSLDISRQPIYSIEGGKSAQSVNFVPPINISATVEIDSSNSSVRDSYSFMDSFNEDSLIIDMKDRTLSQTIVNFNVPNVEVVGESLSSSSDGQPSKTIQFVGFLA